jgi:proteasome lid subunit RPN8/RPN11
MTPYLRVPGEILDAMVDHCRSVFPNEACGILAGSDGDILRIYKMTNAEPSPVSYLMDPAEQFRVLKEMRGEGTVMVAIYHSHPVSQPVPSATDINLAYYPDSVYIIVGLLDFDRPDIRAFRISDGLVLPVLLRTEQ